MQLVFEQIRVGGDRNFGYLLGDRDAGEAALIDPSYTPDDVVRRAADQHLRVTYIINTHGHPDHTNGNARAVELTHAPVAGHRALPMAPTVPLDDADELAVGGLRLRFVFTPGHAADHLVVYEQVHDLLITGDVLFVGKIGGTRTEEDARTEWDGLQHLLSIVPDNATVWPGHDYGARPSSTVGLEKNTNPFLRCANAEELIRLKAIWPEYKKQHGLK